MLSTGWPADSSRPCHCDAAMAAQWRLRAAARLTRDGGQQVQLVLRLQAVADAVWVHHVGAQALRLQPHMVGAPGEASVGRGGVGGGGGGDSVGVGGEWGRRRGASSRPCLAALVSRKSSWQAPERFQLLGSPQRASPPEWSTPRTAPARPPCAAPPWPTLPSLELGLQAGAVARLHAAALRHRQAGVKHSTAAWEGWDEGLRQSGFNEPQEAALQVLTLLRMLGCTLRSRPMGPLGRTSCCRLSHRDMTSPAHTLGATAEHNDAMMSDSPT